MAEKTTESTTEDEDIIPVGPNVDEPSRDADEDGDKTLKSKTGEEDTDEGSDEDDDAESGADERVGHGEADGGNKPRRLSHKERRAKQRESKERDRAELRLLRARNEELERRFSTLDRRVSGSEVAAIDARAGQIKAQIKVAEQVIAEAVEKGRGEDVVEAQNIKQELETALERLSQAKGAVAERARESQRSPESGPSLSAAGKALGQGWAATHSWYDPSLGDEDSAIVGVIDTALSREGTFDPNTPAYWTELNRRLASRLPHRFKKSNGNGHQAAVEDEDDEDDVDETPPRKPTGPRFATGGRERPLRKNEVYISPERKAALIEAGAWDDPVLRKKYLKKYQEWDREHGKQH